MLRNTESYWPHCITTFLSVDFWEGGSGDFGFSGMVTLFVGNWLQVAAMLVLYHNENNRVAN